MTDKISPFAPKAFPVLPPVAGFDMATAEAGVRYAGRTDLWVLRAAPGTSVAGVFTKNKCPGAPVDFSKNALNVDAGDAPRLVVVNSGTANVFTGQLGRDAVQETARGMAETFGGSPEAVFIASTGVIGERLIASKVTAQFPDMKTRMEADGWEAAARAIMTTDTYAKGATATAMIGETQVTINGIVKGSGMIAPDMATMLGYIVTDADIAQNALRDMLSDLTETTFNSITVDSDTSTSDTVMLLASGKAGNAQITDPWCASSDAFFEALRSVMLDLALQVVKDGEGASKFITVKVTGAVDKASARRIGLSVANSPLVKTAIAGEDANWGRIVMAVGKAGEPAERDKLTISLGPHTLAANGELSPGYSEKAGAKYMKNSEIDLGIDLALGTGEARVWTCDLTHGYIDINADYRS